MNPDFSWTDAGVLVLHQGLADGLSCSEMGAQLGITRNAVIGKLHRLGLTSSWRPKGHAKPGPKPVRKQQPWKARTVCQQPVEPVMETNEATDQAIPIEQRRTLVELEPHHCRWPVGEGAGVWFCGATALEDRSYCATHCRRAFQSQRNVPQYHRENLRRIGRERFARQYGRVQLAMATTND